MVVICDYWLYATIGGGHMRLVVICDYRRWSYAAIGYLLLEVEVILDSLFAPPIVRDHMRTLVIFYES